MGKFPEMHEKTSCLVCKRMEKSRQGRGHPAIHPATRPPPGHGHQPRPPGHPATRPPGHPDTQPPTTHATTGHGQPAIRPAGYPNHRAGHGHGPATATHEKKQSSLGARARGACKKTCCSTGNLLRNFGSFWGPCRHLVGSRVFLCLVDPAFCRFYSNPIGLEPHFPHISPYFHKFSQVFFQISRWSSGLIDPWPRQTTFFGTAGDWDIWPYLQASQAKPSR